MKKTICVALSIFWICASPFNLNTYAFEQADELLLTEISIDDNSLEIQEPTTEAEEPPTDDEPTYPDIPTDTQDIPDINDVSDPDLYEPVAEYIPVEDIELSEFNEEMYVKDIQNLSATVFPATATEQTVRYSSSNSAVAKVSQTGKLTAVGKGDCRIYVTCDNMSVYYDLKVKVKTESINVKSKYVVIKPDEQFNLESSVYPDDASQELKYKSKDDSIAVVGNDGIITAKSVGSTSIIVSNEDITILVNVMVSTDSKETTIHDANDNNIGNSNSDLDALTKRIKESNDKQIIVKGIEKIPSSVLKELYGTNKTLIVELDEYDITIKGQDISNANNEIYTKLNFSNTSNGLIVKLNDDNKLPGTISITLKNAPENYKYFYLVDEQNNDYQRLNSLANNEFKVSSVGEYLLSTKDMSRFKINIIWILGAIGVILLLSVIYIFTKKKHWFW